MEALALVKVPEQYSLPLTKLHAHIFSFSLVWSPLVAPLNHKCCIKGVVDADEIHHCSKVKGYESQALKIRKYDYT